ncbi:MAG TPA: hypothetical protein VIV55_01395 [Flavobacterium sp.]
MLVSNSAFWIFLITSIIITFVIVGTLEQSKSQKTLDKKRKDLMSKIVASYLFFAHPIFLILYIFSFSNVYLIHRNGTYEDKILIFPLRIYNCDLTYGNHCYVVNNSSNSLEAKMNVYGMLGVNLEKEREEAIVAKKFHNVQNTFSAKKYEINEFDYIMENAPDGRSFRKTEERVKYSINSTR